MFKHSLIAVALAATLVACGGKPEVEVVATTPTTAAATKIVYPTARTVEQIDDYHGTKVSDPYRWMENLEDPELKTWVAAENKLFNDFIGDVPNRDKLKARLTELWNYERYG